MLWKGEEEKAQFGVDSRRVYSPSAAVSSADVLRDCSDAFACRLLPAPRLGSTNHRLGRRKYRPAREEGKIQVKN